MRELSDIAYDVDQLTMMLERAQAVHTEAEDYFTNTDELCFLPKYAEHISILLYVAYEYMQNVSAAIENIRKDLLAKKGDAAHV